jgi:hypothetical protein
VFIRFVCTEIDKRSHVSAGLFCAAAKLRSLGDVPDYELDALSDVMDWFNTNLDSPFEYLPKWGRYVSAICWFKATACEHLARAWEMVEILERNYVLIQMIKSSKTGYVLYEDDAQVFAKPFADVRAVL